MKRHHKVLAPAVPGKPAHPSPTPGRLPLRLLETRLLATRLLATQLAVAFSVFGSLPARATDQTAPKAPAHGAEPAAARPFVLSETGAIQQALLRSPSVVAARQRAEAARLLAGSSPSAAAPVLKLGTVDALADNTSLPQQRRATAGLQWAPPRPGEMDAKRSLTRAQAEELQALAEAEELSTVLLVRRAYRRLLVLRERLPLLDEGERLNTRLSGARAALRQTQTLSADEDVVRDEARRLEPLGEWASTVAQLAHLLQDPLLLDRKADTLVLDGASGDMAVRLIESSKRPVADLASAAMAHRPEIKAAAARCRALEAATMLRQSDGRLSLRDIEISYSTNRDQRTQAMGLQLAINLPIGGGTTGGSAVMAADRKTCRAEQAAVVANVQHQVTQEHLRRLAAVRNVQDSVVYGLPVQEQFLKNMTLLWQERRVHETRLLSVELRRVQHRLRALEHIDQLLQLDASVRAATGEPDLAR